VRLEAVPEQAGLHVLICASRRCHTVRARTRADSILFRAWQEDLVWLEAKDDQDAVETEEFYAGGGQVARRGLEHFPQLWCPPGRYSVYGQARAPLCCAMSASAHRHLRASGLVCLPLCVHRPCMTIGLPPKATATGLSSETTAWSGAMLGCRCRWPHARARRGRQLFFTPLSQALRLVIHLGEPLPPDALDRFSTDARALLLFFGLPYALMMWTNGVGASTGMFVPALAVGATGARPLLVLPLHCHGA
jgi:hypothetical protein